jgi:hypothetical protein
VDVSNDIEIVGVEYRLVRFGDIAWSKREDEDKKNDEPKVCRFAKEAIKAVREGPLVTWTQCGIN